MAENLVLIQNSWGNAAMGFVDSSGDEGLMHISLHAGLCAYLARSHHNDQERHMHQLHLQAAFKLVTIRLKVILIYMSVPNAQLTSESKCN